MGEEVAMAARAAQELAPAARQFAAAIGHSGPGSELMTWLGDMIRYRRLPHQARLLMRAAEKIQAAGLPTEAVPDRLLRAVLEDGGFEDDAEMQERWSDLLANAAMGHAVPPAFPEILRQLVHAEARFLERLVDRDGRSTRVDARWGLDEEHHRLDDPALLPWEQLGNLERLALIEVIRLASYPNADPPYQLGYVKMTRFGRAFMNACRTPEA